MQNFLDIIHHYRGTTNSVCVYACVCLFQLAEMSNDNKCDLPYVYVKILASKMTKKQIYVIE
jgi:hypothetical protein